MPDDDALISRLVGDASILRDMHSEALDAVAEDLRAAAIALGHAAELRQRIETLTRDASIDPSVKALLLNALDLPSDPEVAK